MVAVTYPGVRQRPVSYAGEAGPFSLPPLGWILHVTCMTGSPWRVFERAPSGSRRFSHLWFAKDGSGEGYARLDHRSWAQGDGNARYWSIETEGQPDEPLTEGQLDALARWHVWCGADDVLADRPGQRGIGTHYMGGAAWGGHTCPDPRPGAGPRSRQRAEIIRRARLIRSGRQATAQEDDMHLSELAGWDVSRQVGEPDRSVNFQTAIGRIYKATVKAQAAQIDYAKLADELIKRGVHVDAAAVADELAKRLAD